MKKDWELLGFLVLTLCFHVSNGQKVVCTQEAVADIVFLVDGSASIGLENFQQIREFLSSLVSTFEIAPDKVQIGLVQYSDTPRTEFLLNSYRSKEEILNYIKNLRYKAGGTHTGQGLEFLLKHHFTREAGSRIQDNVPQIAIVITDGNSQDDVKPHAQELRERGIKLYAIGIKDAEETLLREIANKPYDQHVHSVSDFKALQGISQSISQELCTTVEEAHKEVTISTKGCNESAQADIVLLVDSSGSIGEKDFAEVKKFLHAVVNKFNLQADKVRLGLAQFSDQPYPEFPLGGYLDTVDLHQKLDNLIYRKGGTNTGQALTFIRENYFSLARSNVPRIAIVITDGESRDPVEEPAQKLRNQGVAIFIIRVGKGNISKLRTIANSPHEEFLFSIDNYQELQGLQESLRNKVCFTVSDQLLGFVPKFADLFILVDSLASRQDLSLIKNFLPRLINQLNPGKNLNRVGLAQFSEDVKEEFLLNTDKTRTELVTHVRNMQLRPTGERRIGNAIQYAHKHFFTATTGSRVSDGSKQFLLVLAAGGSADGVVQAARTIRKDAVTVFSVGLPKADLDEMEDISTRSHSFRIVNNNMASQVQQKIKTAIEQGDLLSVTQECTLDVVADIAFIVDQSSSIRSRSFHLVRSFLEDTITGLDVGKGKIKVAVVLYSDIPRADVYFNTFDDKADILRYINSISYGRGKTYTGAALKFAKEHVFTKARGSRKDEYVQQVAVVITDGKSTDDAASAAATLRRSGITVFALGIKDTKESDLKEIASYPPRKFVFNLERFDKLNSLAKILTRALCNDVSDAIIPVTKFSAIQEGCKLTAEADIYFLLDESGSISYNDFEDMKNFIMEFLEVFDIAPDKVRIGAVKFASRATVSFRLNTYSTEASVQQAVKDLIMEGGGTRTDLGLFEMILLFKEAASTRGKKVRELLIVITDGKSEDRGTPVEVPAEELRKMNVSIYAIGVKNASMSELELISGSKKRTFYVQNYDFLKNIKKEILKEICSFEACEGLLADIVFLIDGSERIDPEDFNKTKDLLEFMVDNFAIGPDKERVAVVQYGTNPNEEFLLDAFDDKNKIIQEIRAITQVEGKAYTGKALAEVLQTFDELRGGRPKAINVLIVLTNGESKDEVATPAISLRERGINIFSIGMGQSNRSQILDIAGSHERVFHEENFQSLHQLGSEVLLKICNTECKRPELMDVIFLVDASGTPNKNSFQEMKSFMLNVVSKSEVGEKRVRFGTIVYSNSPQSEFKLNQYNKNTDVQRAIMNLRASGGDRNTAQALKYALTYFSHDHGGRRAKNIPQVLFLITDGQVEDHAGLTNWTNFLAASEVNFFAIGTEGAQEEELKMIAGKKGKVFYVHDYQALTGLQKQITRELCNLTKPVCEKEVADLVFLIDGSESIKPPSWDIVKKTMFGIVKELDIAQDKWRVGVAQFSDIFMEHFYLNTYSSLAEVNAAIQNISQRKQGTNTWMAMKRINEYFTPKYGSRLSKKVSQNLLLITDGEANDEKNLNALADLKAKKVEITVIGVGNEIRKSELLEIAGSTDRVLIETFESLKLKTTIRKVLSLLCQYDPSGNSSDCSIDIGIGFDVSRRMATQPLLRPQVEPLVRAAIHSFSVTPNLCCIEQSDTNKIETKIGYRLVSGQDGRVLEDFDFEKYSEDVLRKVLLLRPSTPLAFNTFLLDSFREKFVPSNAKFKILIIFTDGLDDSIEHLMVSSERLRHSEVSALLIVSLEGVMEFHQLEFGRAFDYMQPLSINMLNTGNALMKQIESVALRECCNLSCSCTGIPGPRGPPGLPGEKGQPGKMGYPGYPGDEGPMGERGPPGLNGTQGHSGCRGNRGVKGHRGYTGNKGDDGEDGLDGVDGEQGDTGLHGVSGPKGDPGDAGMKGLRGNPGPKGHSGVRGAPGSPGLDNSTPGLKGEKGDVGVPGDEGFVGPPGDNGESGDPGAPGRRGQIGLPGVSSDERGDTGQRGPQGYPGQMGPAGRIGPKGENGEPGVPGVQGAVGPPGVEGSKGMPGGRGPRGLPGDMGIKGDTGTEGFKGPPGQDGGDGFGPAGPKGKKGSPGYIGFTGLQGEDGAEGSSGGKGHKGYPGTPGNIGASGIPGAPGERGMDGHRGNKGPSGMSVMPECELVEYIRKNCACCTAHGSQCPAYPTELLLALDMSTGLTAQVFERMRSAALSLLQNISIAETACPWGARVSVISYSSESKYLIRFSDHHQKKLLLQAVSMIPLERTTKTRNIGQAMRFVARNVFKRVREGRLMRKVAVFFTNGPSSDASSIATAMLEFKAADIGLGVIALRPADDVQQAVQVDDTGSYIVVDGEEASRIKQCVLCFDRCNPDPACGITLKPEPLQIDLDLSVLMDSSENLNTQQYLGVKDLTLTLFDHIDMSSEPSTADGKTRMAVYQQSSIYGSSYIHEEFSFTTFKDRNMMKRHITDTVQQVGGVSRPEFALEWMITNSLLKVERPRKRRMIVAVFGDDSEHLSKAQLDYVSKLCKCQNVVMFIVMTGQKFDWSQMEKLTNSPLEQRLVFMGSARQRDREYAGRFINAFLHLLNRELIPQLDVQARECDAFNPKLVEFGQSPERDIIPTVPPTEAPEEYEDVYEEEDTQSYPNDSTDQFAQDALLNNADDHTEPPKTKNDVCQLEYDAGRCSDYSVKWYFNIHSGECLRFWYGGCEGNSNRFNTLKDCEIHCVKAST